MLTNEDIQKLVKHFATKEDLERFATKEDLERFATKEDLERFATKEDLDERSSGLLKEIFANRENLEIFKEEMRKNFSDLLTSVGAYVKKADTYFQEMVMLGHKVDRHEKWIRQIADKLGIKLEYF